MKKILSNKKIIILLSVIIVFIAIVVAILMLNNKNSKVGNSPSNIANMGFAVEAEGYTFYNKYENGIYKTKGDSQEEVRIGDDNIGYSLNVSNGYLYYLALNTDDNYKVNIVKIKTDGSEKEILKTIVTSSTKMYLIDDNIYYRNDENGENKVYKIDINGKNEAVVVNKYVSNFQVDDENIYYSDNDLKLYKMNLKNSEEKEVSDKITTRYFQVIDKWIYFIDDSQNRLSKIKIDGKEILVISDKINSEIFSIKDDKIYYLDSNSHKICRMKTDGTDIKELVDLGTSQITRINIAQNNIYYLGSRKLDSNAFDSLIYQMYRIGINGEQVKEILY